MKISDKIKPMNKNRFCIFSVLFLIINLFISCSGGIVGYSVVLWNFPENGILDGEIVPVYIKSNISQVYVIGTENGKTELPLWALTSPESKRKAEKTFQKYADYNHTFATVALDGLPMRAEPVNTSKQVYRLRQDEIVKILFKGQGQAPMSGKKALEGDWLRVLTKDGTQGWCFSYNLRQFKIDKDGNPIIENVLEEENTRNEEFEALLQQKWYPDSYKGMLKAGRINIEKLNPEYYFTFDAENQKIYFAMPGIYNLWDYTGAEKNKDGSISLLQIPVKITIKNRSFIVVRYTGEDGKPEDFNLVPIDEDLYSIIENEKNRRETEFLEIFNFGPSFKSSSYGTLSLLENHLFRWTNTKLLVNQALISKNARNSGTVEIKYFISRQLSSAFDGVLTFTFDGMTSEVNFLYKIEEQGLRLEDATRATINNNMVVSRSTSPLVIFFSKME